jgi:hypothetical protein
MKVVINRGYGGFALSDAAYQKLIERGIPVRRYDHSKSSADNISAWQEDVIFDRHLDDPPQSAFGELDRRAFYEFEDSRYWDLWSQHRRAHPMLVSIVLEMGAAAAAADSDLEVIEIPDGVKFVIRDDHGIEYCAEEMRTWGGENDSFDRKL